MNIEKTLLRIYSKYKVFFVNLNAFIYFCFVLRNITFQLKGVQQYYPSLKSGQFHAVRMMSKTSTSVVSIYLNGHIISFGVGFAYYSQHGSPEPQRNNKLKVHTPYFYSFAFIWEFRELNKHHYEKYILLFGNFPVIFSFIMWLLLLL